jgi:glucose dehydrogenase
LRGGNVEKHVLVGSFVAAVLRMTDEAGRRPTDTELSPTTMLVGIDATTDAVRWELPLASVDALTVKNPRDDYDGALVGGRFFGVYAAAKWHVTAVDVKTGKRLWDVALQPISGEQSPMLLASTSRVYVGRLFSIEVREASTGTLIGVLGANEDYK